MTLVGPERPARASTTLAVWWCIHALLAGRLGAQSAETKQDSDSAFILATDDPHRSPSPFIGNGRIGVVIPPLGVGSSISLYAGLYEKNADDVPRIAAVPAWNAIAVFDGKQWLDSGLPPDSMAREYRQTVDMRTGIARTSYQWADGGSGTSVRVEAFVSRANPRLAGTRIELTPRQRARMRVRFALAGWPPPKRLPLDTLKRIELSWGPAELWYPGHSVVRSRNAALERGGGRVWMTSNPEGRKTVLAQSAVVSWPGYLTGASTSTRLAPDTALVEVAFDASPGRTYAFTQIVAFALSKAASSPLPQAHRVAAAARAIGYDSLIAASARAWRERWDTDIEIDGDPALQRVVRSMLFYLLSSADSGTALGIPPMGLSSGGYYGHIFWDSDTWMFPSLLLTHPDVAHSLVAFRVRTLPAARANARANGYRGAMYPWEADEQGRETTPHFAVQNARSEIHVTGDVAQAQWQYYLATGDSAWLARDGFPVIRGTADFWVSRASYDSSTGMYHIRNVVSVAEGLIGVTDDAYTNAVARKTLEIAALASKRLGKVPDPRWARVATRLHLPYDSASQYFRTYEGAPDSTLGWVTPLLSYPLGIPMNAQAKRSQLQQAARQLLARGPGAMMGSTLLSVDAAELGDRALVDTLLAPSYQGHLRGPFLMLSETPRNNAVNFVTGAGGFLQQVIYGYTGIRLGEKGLEPAFPPVLPSRIRRLVLRNVHVRDRAYDIVVDSTGRRIVPHDSTAR